MNAPKKAARKKPDPKPVVTASGWLECPKHIKRSGRSQWLKGEALWIRGEITVQDIEAWQMLCEAFDERDHCAEVLKTSGEYHKSSQGGYQEHPAIKRIRSVEGKILRYQRLFGLVPEARKKRPAVQQGVTTRKRN